MQNKGLLIGIGSAILIFIVVVLIIIFGGNKNKKQGVGLESYGPTTITLWTPIEDPEVYDPFAEALQEFNIKLVVEKKEPDTYEEDLVNEMAAGRGPDILVLKNDRFAKHASKLVASPEFQTDYTDTVAEYKKTYAQVVSEDLVMEDLIAGLPLGGDPLVLYVNEDLYRDTIRQYRKEHEEDNPVVARLAQKKPTTWDDFQEMSRLMTKKSGSNISISGAALGTTGNVPDATDILYLLMTQNGAKFNSVDKKLATFHTSTTTLTGTSYFPGTKALEFYTSFSKTGDPNYSWNESMPNAIRAFMDGKVGMMVGYASTQNFIRQINPTLDYDIYPLPQVRETLTPAGFTRYWALGVSRNSKSQKAAWEVIYFLANGKNRSKYLRATGFYDILKPEKNKFSIESQIGQSHAIYKPDALKYDAVMKDMIDKVAKFNQNPQTSIESAASQITKLLSGD